jgi:1,4-alpha-glucan branching enzyme
MQLFRLYEKETKKDDVFVVCNFTQVIRENYRIGIPRKGKLKEIFNSDAKNIWRKCS